VSDLPTTRPGYRQLATGCSKGGWLRSGRVVVVAVFLDDDVRRLHVIFIHCAMRKLKHIY